MTHVRDAKFVVKEYLGTEVFKSLDPETRYFPKEGLKDRDDLKAGDKIIVPWMTGGYVEATVNVDEAGGYFGEAGQLIIPLSFAGDDRKCWTVAGFVNKRGVTKLCITLPPDPPPPDHSPPEASAAPSEPSSTLAAPPTTGSDPSGQPPP